MSSTVSAVRLLALSYQELVSFLKSLGGYGASADRLFRYLHREGVSSFEGMTDLDSALKSRLEEHAIVGLPDLVSETVSADAQTRKSLFRLDDGLTVESALMLFRNTQTGRERRTVCVSTQVGCALGCPYCATGNQGFERDLLPGEIVGQVYDFISRFGSRSGESDRSWNWVTHVVFMGMGEPLANYENVMKAVAILNSQRGLGLGFHQVTVSTAGLVPEIRRLAGERLQFQLAVSLHAAKDELRDHLVPVNRKYPLGELMEACRDYAGSTGRKVFIEYALFEGMNDSIDQASDLLRLLEGLDCSINLIIGNPTCSDGFQPSSKDSALAFQKRLIAGGVRTMLRVSRGADIDAGCGQLRSRWFGI